jgi:predicted ATPase/DNA-binding CsgD family transcriptional regulator
MGRTEELAQLNTLLLNPACRLLTLVGVGGIGKTRLALEAASQVVGEFPDGVYFVPLQPLTQADLIVSGIAESLRLSFYGQDEPDSQLINYLGKKHLLLLLDNFEHLLDGVGFVSELLVAAPQVKIMTTSREVLNLQEEWLFPLKGMSFPLSVYTEEIEGYEAVRFFLHNARRAQPDFSLTDERHEIINICRLTEGIPLAIELAASWVKVLSGQQIVAEMQRGLDFLATTTRNIPERHRSMRAVFNHSWNFLSEEERRVFEKLSVFRGGFERHAAEQISGAALPILAALVEKSLLRKLASGRYDIHELLRQFAYEQLEASGTADIAHNAHSRYYADFTQQCETDLKGRRQIGVLSEIEADFDNIRTAWTWALQRQHIEILLSMLESLLWFGLIRSRQRDVDALFQQVLTQITGTDATFVKAWIIAWESLLLPHDEPPGIVAARLKENLTVIQRYGNETEIAIYTLLLGLFLGGTEQRDFKLALTCDQDSFTYFQSVGDRYYLAYALHAFAMAYYYQGDRSKAMQLADECAQLRREIGDHYGTARILLLVAAEAYSIPDYDKSERFNREVRDIWRELKSWNYVAFVNVNLAYLAIFRGDFEAARVLLEESLEMAKLANIADNIAYALGLSGVLASLEERYTEAWQLLSEARRLATFTSSIEAIEWGLPMAACGLGDYQTARSANQRALQFSHRLNAPGRYLWHLPASSAILAHEGQLERATEILSLIFTHPASATPWLEKWPLLARLRADLETALGTDVYQAAWEWGTTLELEKVVTELIAEFQEDNESKREIYQPLADPLSQRELEVLTLLAAGLSNREIAEQLVIGIGTVKTHTLNIYAKLEVNSRTQAIARARELKLLRA